MFAKIVLINQTRNHSANKRQQKNHTIDDVKAQMRVKAHYLIEICQKKKERKTNQADHLISLYGINNAG